VKLQGCGVLIRDNRFNFIINFDQFLGISMQFPPHLAIRGADDVKKFDEEVKSLSEKRKFIFE
jgi:hypothetical protein